MRLTLQILGHTFEVSLEPTACECETNSLDGGATYSQPISFVSHHDAPEEIPLPQRTPAWDDEE